MIATQGGEAAVDLSEQGDSDSIQQAGPDGEYGTEADNGLGEAEGGAAGGESVGAEAVEIELVEGGGLVVEVDQRSGFGEGGRVSAGDRLARMVHVGGAG